MYEMTEKKLTVIVNAKYEVPSIMNAIGHLCLSIGGQATPNLIEYRNENAGLSGLICRDPIVILKAKNGQQLSRALAGADELGAQTAWFSSTMFGTSASQQQAATRDASELDLVAVALFDAPMKLHPLTKKFSVFKISSGSMAAQSVGAD